MVTFPFSPTKAGKPTANSVPKKEAEEGKENEKEKDITGNEIVQKEFQLYPRRSFEDTEKNNMWDSV